MDKSHQVGTVCAHITAFNLPKTTTNMYLRHCAILLATFLLCSTLFETAKASTVIADTGAPTTFFQTLLDINQSGGVIVAGQFTIGSTFQIDQVSSTFRCATSICGGSGGEAPIIMSIWSDNSGEPGTMLASDSFSIPADTPTGILGIFNNIDLTIGPGNYWVSFHDDGCVPVNGLCEPRLGTGPSSPLTSYKYFSFGTNSWGDTSTGFNVKVEGTIVPIPAAVWLFSSGLLGLVSMARRKKA